MTTFKPSLGGGNYAAKNALSGSFPEPAQCDVDCVVNVP